MIVDVLPAYLVGDDVCFEHDNHAYIDADKQRIVSATQALKIAGLIDYSRVPYAVLLHASTRGKLVHHASALIDRGEDLSAYEVPDEVQPYVDAYLLFLLEMRFAPDPRWVETPMIVDMFGHRVGMTPDVVGMMDGVPTLIERKATSAAHPSWAVQTAAYALGLRTAGVQIRQRCAVQLLPTGKYKLFTYTNDSDFQTFGDAYRVAAWKLANKLATLD